MSLKSVNMLVFQLHREQVVMFHVLQSVGSNSLTDYLFVEKFALNIFSK